MQFYNDNVSALAKEFRNFFSEFEKEVNDYIFKIKDEYVDYQTFKDNVISLKFQNKMKILLMQYFDVIQFHNVEMSDALGYEMESVQLNNTEQFKKIMSLKISEYLESKYQEYQQLKLLTNDFLSEYDKNKIEQLAKKYKTFDYKKLLEKSNDNDRLYLNSINQVLVTRHLELLQFKIKLEEPSKTATSLNATRSFFIGNYLAICLTDMLGEALMATTNHYYEVNNVKKVVWLNSMPSRICSICEPYWNKVFDYSKLEQVPKMHTNCRCYLVPADNENIKNLIK